MATLEELVKRGRYPAGEIDRGLAEAARQIKENMRPRRKRFRPQPAATPWAQRLELVRREHGMNTLLDFYEALIEGGELGVSYSSVRNYHTNREPSVTYLVRVAARFGVDPGWLLTGGFENFGVHPPHAPR